jgi:hypothetical protein
MKVAASGLRSETTPFSTNVGALTGFTIVSSTGFFDARIPARWRGTFIPIGIGLREVALVRAMVQTKMKNDCFMSIHCCFQFGLVLIDDVASTLLEGVGPSEFSRQQREPTTVETSSSIMNATALTIIGIRPTKNAGTPSEIWYHCASFQHDHN